MEDDTPGDLESLEYIFSTRECPEYRLPEIMGQGRAHAERQTPPKCLFMNEPAVEFSQGCVLSCIYPGLVGGRWVDLAVEERVPKVLAQYDRLSSLASNSPVGFRRVFTDKILYVFYAFVNTLPGTRPVSLTEYKLVCDECPISAGRGVVDELVHSRLNARSTPGNEVFQKAWSVDSSNRSTSLSTPY